jgi:hypothetical protein
MTYVKPALQLSISPQLHENEFIEQKPDKIEGLGAVCAFVVGHGKRCNGLSVGDVSLSLEMDVDEAPMKTRALKVRNGMWAQTRPYLSNLIRPSCQ